MSHQGLENCWISVSFKHKEAGSNINEHHSNRTDELANKARQAGKKKRFFLPCPPGGAALVSGGSTVNTDEEVPPEVPSSLRVSWFQMQSNWQPILVIMVVLWVGFLAVLEVMWNERLCVDFHGARVGNEYSFYRVLLLAAPECPVWKRKLSRLNVFLFCLSPFVCFLIWFFKNIYFDF